MADETKRTDSTGVSEFATSVEQASNSLESALSKINTLIAQFNDFITGMSRRVGTFSKNANDLTSSLKPMNTALSNSVKQFERLDELQFTSLGRFKELADSARSSITALTADAVSQFDKLNSADLNNITGDLAGIEGLNNTLKNVSSTIGQMSEQASILRGNLNEVKIAGEGIDFDKAVNDLIKVSALLQDEILKTITAIRTELAGLSKSSNDISKFNETLKTVGDTLKNIQNDISALKESVSSLGDVPFEFKNIQKGFNSLKKSFEKLSKDIAPADEALAPMTRFANVLSIYEKALDKFFSNSEAIGKSAVQLSKDLNELGGVKIDGKNLKLNDFIGQVTRLQAILNKEGGSSFDVEKFKILISELQGALNQLENNTPNVKGTVDSIKEFSDAIRSLNAASSDVKVSQRTSSIISFFREVSKAAEGKGRIKDFEGVADTLSKLNAAFANFNVSEEKLNALREIETIINDFSTHGKREMNVVAQAFEMMAKDIQVITVEFEKLGQAISLKNLDTSQYQNLNGLMTGLINTITQLKKAKISAKDSDSLKSTFDSLTTTLKSANTALQPVNTIQTRIGVLNDALTMLKTAINDIKTLNASTVSTKNLNNTIQAFVSAISQLNAFKIGNIASVNGDLQTVVTTFNTLRDALTAFEKVYTRVNNMPAMTLSVDAYFSRMLTSLQEVIDLLNVFVGLNDDVDGMNQKFEQLARTISNVQGIMNQFNKLVQTTSTSINTGDLVARFRELENVFQTLNTAMAGMKGGNVDFTAYSAELNAMRDSMRSIVSVMRSLETMTKKTFDTSQVSNFENQVRALAGAMITVQSSFAGFTMSSTELAELAQAIREVNKLLTQMERLTNRAATNAGTDMGAVQTYFTELMTVIENLITRVNALSISSTNVADLVSLLQTLTVAFNSANAGANRFGNGMNGNGNRMNQFGAQTRAATADLYNFNKAFADQNAITGMNRLLNSFSKLRFGIQGLIFTLGGKTLWNWTIGNNADMEIQMKAFEMILGTARKAKETILDLRGYAALTAFEMPEVLTAGESLASARLDVNKWVQIAGDLASAKKSIGIELNDVVMVITRINAGDFGKATARLRQMGISLTDLRAQGLEFSKSNQYLGSVDQYLGALERIINERFGGLTLSMSSTFKGLWNNLSDVINMMGISFGADLFSDVKQGLFEVNEQMQGFQYTDTFKGWTASFNQAKNDIKNFFQVVGPPVMAVLKLIMDNLDKIVAIVQIQLVKALIGTVGNGFMKILSSLGTWLNNQRMINQQMRAHQELLRQEWAMQGAINTQLTRREMLLARMMAMQKANALKRPATQQEMAGYVTESLSSLGYGNSQYRRTGINKFTSAFGGMNIRQGMEPASNLIHGMDPTVWADTATTHAQRVAAMNATATAAGNARAVQTAAAQTSMAAAGAGVAGATGAATGAASGIAGVVASVGAALGVIMGIVAALGAVALAVRFIFGFFKDQKKIEFATSVSEYDQILGKQSEEIEKLEQLNRTRATQNQRLELQKTRISELKQQQASGIDVSDKLAAAEQKYSDVQERIIRSNRAIVDVSSDLHNALYDEEGRVRDLTSAYEAQTEAIAKNINMRKELYNETKKSQMEQVEIEKGQNQKRIEEIQTVLAGVKQGGNRFGNWLKNAGLGMLDWITNTSEPGTDKQIAKILLDGDNARASAVSSLEKELRELQDAQRDLASRGIDYSELIKFMESDKDRFWVYYENSNQWDWDFQKGEVVMKQVKEAAEQLIQRLENYPQRIKDIEEVIDARSSKLSKQFDLQLGELELKGFDKDDDEYKQILKEKSDALGNLYLEGIDELTQKSEEVIDMVKDKFFDIPPALIDAIEDGFTVQQIQDMLSTDISKWPADVSEELKNKLLLVKQELMDQLNKAPWLENVAGAMTFLYGEDEMNTLESLQRAIEAFQDALVDKQLEYQKAKLAGLEKEKKNTETAYQQLVKMNDYRKQYAELLSDITLQEAELASNNPEYKDSKAYKELKKRENIKLLDVIMDYLDEVKNIIPSITDPDEKMKAQLQALSLQKEANQLLLDIRDNSEKALGLGEFNKPGSVNAMSYYDYRVLDGRGKNVGALEIANASFAFKIDAIQSMEDVNTMMALVQRGLVEFSSNIRRNESLGPYDPFILK